MVRVDLGRCEELYVSSSLIFGVISFGAGYFPIQFASKDLKPESQAGFIAAVAMHFILLLFYLLYVGCIIGLCENCTKCFEKCRKAVLFATIVLKMGIVFTMAVVLCNDYKALLISEDDPELTKVKFMTIVYVSSLICLLLVLIPNACLFFEVESAKKGKWSPHTKK
ncbi:MAG: hypothetical protein MHMPM18_001674 [Marteilia pararefringens]